jgi:hypothetical protein
LSIEHQDIESPLKQINELRAKWCPVPISEIGLQGKKEDGERLKENSAPDGIDDAAQETARQP